MTTTTFLMLLSSFSVLSGLVTEGIKKLISDKANMSYNIIALVVALVIGGVVAKTNNNTRGLVLSCFAMLCLIIGTMVVML